VFTPLLEDQCWLCAYTVNIVSIVIWFGQQTYFVKDNILGLNEYFAITNFTQGMTASLMG